MRIRPALSIMPNYSRTHTNTRIHAYTHTTERQKSRLGAVGAVQNFNVQVVLPLRAYYSIFLLLSGARAAIFGTPEPRRKTHHSVRDTVCV